MSNHRQYQRDEEIRRKINAFLQDTFNLPVTDYYSRLNITSLLSLKFALSDINNALTMRLTLSFIDQVVSLLSIPESTRLQIFNSVLDSKPCANGYDIHFNGTPAFIAEVKCNVPVNGGNVYGSAQQGGILSDVRVLLNGKSKAANVPENSIKFMVFLDLPAVRMANDRMMKNNPILKDRLTFLAPGARPDNSKIVYGVYAPIGA